MKVLAGPHSLWDSWQNPYSDPPHFSQWLWIRGISWFVAASLSSLPLLLPLCLCLFSSYKETSHIGLRPMLIQHYLILIMPAKPLFPNNVLLTGRSQDRSIPFGDTDSTSVACLLSSPFLPSFGLISSFHFFPSTAFKVLYSVSISLVVILRITICM